MTRLDPEPEQSAKLQAASHGDVELFDRVLRQSLGLSGDIGRDIAALRKLQISVETALEAIQHNQESILPAVGLTMSTFRREAGQYQQCFVKSARRTNWVLGIVVALQLLILACAAWLMTLPGSRGEVRLVRPGEGASATIGTGPLLMHGGDETASREAFETGLVAADSGGA